MNPAARLGDNHACPMLNPDESPHTGGPISEGEDSVLIGGEAAARCGDQAICLGPSDVIATGSCSVFIGNRYAAAIEDETLHGGVLIEGEPTVLIGDSGAGAGGSTGATMRAARNEAAPLCEICSEGQGGS